MQHDLPQGAADGGDLLVSAGVPPTGLTLTGNNTCGITTLSDSATLRTGNDATFSMQGIGMVEKTGADTFTFADDGSGLTLMRLQGDVDNDNSAAAQETDTQRAAIAGIRIAF